VAATITGGFFIKKWAVLSCDNKVTTASPTKLREEDSAQTGRTGKAKGLPPVLSQTASPFGALDNLC